MPEYQFKSKCKVCGGLVIPDARHVGVDGRMGDCIPSSNLEYLEYLYDRSLKNECN